MSRKPKQEGKEKGTFNHKSLGQQAQVIGRLVILCQLLQSHPGTHPLGIPVTTLNIVHFGHQQQSLVQVPGLEHEKQLVNVKIDAGNSLRLGTKIRLTVRRPRLRMVLMWPLALHSLGCVWPTSGVELRNRSTLSTRHSSSRASAISSVA